jgi:hypothetical protein
MTILALILVVLYLFGSIPPMPPIRPHVPRPANRLSTAPQHPPPQRTAQTDHPPNQQNTTDLYRRVAARSLGEASFALAEIACTIKNRLAVSRVPLSTVLRAYRAADVPPKPAQIETVRKVFEGELHCPPTWWYAISLQDTRRWKPHPQPAVIIRRSDRSQIWIFER